jgi:hypothetical protein
MDGTLTIHHDHFSDDEDFDLSKFIKAFDMWNHRRSIQHLSKKGLNAKVVEQLNSLQKENPGKVYLPPRKSNNEI